MLRRRPRSGSRLPRVLLFGAGVWLSVGNLSGAIAQLSLPAIAPELLPISNTDPVYSLLTEENTMAIAIQKSTSVSTTVIAEMEAYLQAHQDLGWFSGSALVVRAGEPIFAEGYGMASLEHQIPNTAETKFRLGSITKQFTAAAILQLQDQGLLNVQAPVSTYLPNYPNGERITIHHLLTHSAGIPNMTSLPDYLQWMRLPITLDELIVRFQDLPLEFEPGERYAYSNSGYVLLTKVIETVSGQSYADYLEANIFTPLGMENTGYEHPLTIIDGIANGYQLTDDGYQRAEYINMNVPQGAGGLYSTIGDLARWNQFLFREIQNEMVLSQEAIALMTTPHIRMSDDTPDISYGYGLVINRSPDYQVIGHDGGINGFVTSLVYRPNDDVTIALLSNIQTANPDRIVRDLSAILFGEPYEMPSSPVAVTVDPVLYERYVGTYQFMPEFQVSVTVENNQLYVQGTGQPIIALYPISETEYFSRIIDDLRIIFNAEADGTIESLTLIQNGAEIIAPKVE